MWDIEILGFSVYFLFYNFFLYSFCGWIWESLFVSIKNKHWVNRGFLNGPIVPLYGAGATVVYVALSGLKTSRPIVIFIAGMLVATVLEYLTSYVMEKLFHTRWWDYSNYKYQFQGRICLLASFFWGFLSILMMDVLQPFMNSVIAQIPRKLGENLGYVIFLIFAVDLGVTIFYTLQMDKKLEELAGYREKFMEYLESTRLYETREELLERMDNLSILGMAESLKQRLEAMDESQQERMAEVREKVRSFLQNYEKRVSLQSIIEKRLLRAFPTMKSMRSTTLISELRKHKKAEEKD